jgi:Arc/MetJ-type ribon-helix-helix transcriptional regulator
MALDEKERLRKSLSDLARRRECIAYGELGARTGFHPQSPRLHELLCEISTEEAEAGRGMLSAVVVKRGTKRPGGGFFDLAERLGREVNQQDTFWRTELELVYAAHNSASRSTVADRAISVRLDAEAQRALGFLTRSGLSRSEAIREALITTAGQRRSETLAEEAKQVAADPEDRAEKTRITELMEALRAAG